MVDSDNPLQLLSIEILVVIFKTLFVLSALKATEEYKEEYSEHLYVHHLGSPGILILSNLLHLCDM